MNSHVPGQLVTMLSWHPNCPGDTDTQRNGSSTTAVKIIVSITLKTPRPRNLLAKSFDLVVREKREPIIREPVQNHSKEGFVPIAWSDASYIKLLKHYLYLQHRHSAQ